MTNKNLQYKKINKIQKLKKIKKIKINQIIYSLLKALQFHHNKQKSVLLIKTHNALHILASACLSDISLLLTHAHSNHTHLFAVY